MMSVVWFLSMPAKDARIVTETDSHEVVGSSVSLGRFHALRFNKTFRSQVIGIFQRFDFQKRSARAAARRDFRRNCFKPQSCMS